MKAEWKSRHELAEYAEALGIETQQIMAVRQTGKTTTAAYSPDLEDDLDPETPIYAVPLARDEDGILRVVGEVTMLSINWREMQAEIEKRMEAGL